jgi:hypothetical protein
MFNMHTEWMLGRLEMEWRERRLARLGPLLAGMPRRPGLLRRLLRRLVAGRHRRSPALAAPASLARCTPGPRLPRPPAGGSPDAVGGMEPVLRRAAPWPGGQGGRSGRWRRCGARCPVDADRLRR